MKGRHVVSLGLGVRKFDHTFLVCPLPTEAAVLLIIDFIEGRNAHIKFEDSKMSFNNTIKDNRAKGDTFGERRVVRVMRDTAFNRCGKRRKRRTSGS